MRNSVLLQLIFALAFAGTAYAQPTFRSVSTTTPATVSTCSPAKPTGLAVGDLMLFHIAQRRTRAVTLTTGWALVDSRSQTNLKSDIFWKIANSTDVAAGSFSFSWTGGTAEAICSVTAISGVNTTTPIGASTGQSNASSVTVSTGSITPTTANSMLMIYVTGGDDQTSSSYQVPTDNPSSWTEAYDVVTNLGNDLCFAMAYGTRAATTSTGTGTATLSLAAINLGQIIAINPTAPTPTPTNTPLPTSTPTPAPSPTPAPTVSARLLSSTGVGR